MATLAEMAAAILGNDTQTAIRAENPYYTLSNTTKDIAEAPLAMITKNPGVYSTSEALRWALGAGLVNGLMQGMGDEYQNTLTDRYSDVLSNSIGGVDVENPGLSGALFGSAKRQGQLFGLQKRIQAEEENRKYEREREGKLYDKLLDFGIMPQKNEKGGISLVRIPGLDVNSQAAAKAAAEEVAKRTVSGDYIARPEAEPIAEKAPEMGSDSFALPKGKALDPQSPKAKAIRDVEDASRSNLKGSQLVTNYGDIKTNFETLKDLYQFNDRSATLAFISSFARVLDPASVVREGEIKNAENTQTFLSGLGYKLESLVNGKQQLDPTVKQGMLRAAGAKYNNFGKAYLKAIENEKGLVSKRGGSAESIFGPYEFEPFDFVEWYKSPARSQKTIAEEVGGASNASIEDQLTLIAEKVAAGKSLSADEAKFVYGIKRMRGQTGGSGEW